MVIQKQKSSGDIRSAASL